jgi:hypothetical protein
MVFIRKVGFCLVTTGVGVFRCPDFGWHTFYFERSSIMEFLTSPITSEKLEQKGQNIYKFAKLGMFLGVCAIALAFIIGILSISLGGEFISPFIFDIDEEYAFAYLFVVVDYLALLLGIASVPMYFAGLNIFALGRIAHNTEKN